MLNINETHVLFMENYLLDKKKTFYKFNKNFKK